METQFFHLLVRLATGQFENAGICQIWRKKFLKKRELTATNFFDSSHSHIVWSGGIKSSRESIELDKILACAGADPNALNRPGDPALFQSTRDRNRSAFRALTAIGASLDLRNPAHRKCLHLLDGKDSRYKQLCITNTISHSSMICCFTCSKPGVYLRCQCLVLYCSRRCQRLDWRYGHNFACNSLWSNKKPHIDIDVEAILKVDKTQAGANLNKVLNSAGIKLINPKPCEAGKSVLVKIQTSTNWMTDMNDRFSPFGEGKSVPLPVLKMNSFFGIVISKENGSFLYIGTMAPHAMRNANHKLQFFVLPEVGDVRSCEGNYFAARWQVPDKKGARPTVLRISHSSDALPAPEASW